MSDEAKNGSSDRDLIARAADGDREAFSALVARHQAMVFRVARTMCRHQQAAEDVLQETFLSAWRGAAGFRGAASAETWLLAIARNACNRVHRRKKHEPSILEPLEGLALDAGWGADSAERVSERLAERDRLRRALEGLPIGDREVIRLVDVEGLTGSDAAGVLGVGLSALKSRLHRARLKLLAALRRQDDEQEEGAA